ncbi:hypothetical protein [Streptomyces sp. NPDC050856]|uniref:hypothetical protein n=1 Tax=unclassified Streptomyces TaxID=2593676 RepID=UPI0033F2F1B6
MSDIEGPGRRDPNKAAAVAGTVQDKAAQGAGLVGEKAADVAGTAKEQAGNVAGEATAQVRDLAGEVRSQLQEQARSQTRNLAENVRRLADELREMSDNGKPGSTAAGVVRQIADGGHQVASRVESRGPDGLLDDLRGFARRRPGMFLAGAALAGFAVARAGKGVSAAGSGDGGDGGERRDTDRPVPATGAIPAGGEPTTPGSGYVEPDPLDVYGQSQPPHYTPGGQGLGTPPPTAPPPPPTSPPSAYPPPAAPSPATERYPQQPPQGS